MRDYYYVDEDVLDKVEVDDLEEKSEEEIKKELKYKRALKAIKIVIYALMGAAAARLFYKTSNEKDRNTDYLDRF